RDHRHAEAIERHGGQRIDVSGRLALAQARPDLTVDGVEDFPEVEAADVELVLDRFVHWGRRRGSPPSLPQTGPRRPPACRRHRAGRRWNAGAATGRLDYVDPRQPGCPRARYG